jgi:hypothetical protein
MPAVLGRHMSKNGVYLVGACIFQTKDYGHEDQIILF